MIQISNEQMLQLVHVLCVAYKELKNTKRGIKAKGYIEATCHQLEPFYRAALNDVGHRPSEIAMTIADLPHYSPNRVTT